MVEKDNMTTQKINDAAKKLTEDLLWRASYTNSCQHELEPIVQSALTAARQEGMREMRERAAKMFDSEHNAGQTIARTIRALPVEGE